MPKSILIVEDEVIIAQLIANILTTAGYDIAQICNNHDSAVAFLKIYTPSLVLLDIKLRGIPDGTLVAAYLQQHTNVPFVYITSFSDSNTLNKAKATKPHAYLIKPFRPTDILATVALVLYNTAPSATKQLPYRLQLVLQYIDAHLTENIKLADLVKLTTWQGKHFMKMFTDHLQTTPHQYILQQKIKLAELMIKKQDTTLKQIAFELGFKSYSNFSVAYKKYFGKVPN